MTLLKVSGIIKKGDENIVLDHINFVQKKHQKIAVVGETGSGKSTLLKIIAGLIQQDAGTVLLENELVKGPSERLVPGHPSIAYLSQYFELQKFLTVEQILSYANSLSQKAAAEIYEICQIDHLIKRKTDQLSGGEKQRIAMARLLIGSPKLLLLDEPFSHLDMVHKTTLKSVIRNISKKLKITCILVSHDPEDILSWADKILVMKEGQIMQEGTPEKIYREPINAYVAGLFGKYNAVNDDLANIFFSGKNKHNGKLILRPEDFKLSKKGKKAYRGEALHINYFGSYYEIEVLVSKSIIVIRSEKEKEDFTPGDEVYISLNL